MLNPDFAAFMRRLIYLCACAAFAYACVLTLDAPIETPLGAFVLAALMALAAFVQDWRIGQLKRERDKAKEQAQGASAALANIATICAEYFDPKAKA